MFKYPDGDGSAFRPLEAEQILIEMEWEDETLVQALTALRSRPGDELRQRVRALSAQRPGRVAAARETGRRIRLLLPRPALRAGAVSAALLVVMALLLATVPSVRAAIGRLVEQRFGLVLVEQISVPPALSEPSAGSGAHVDQTVITPLDFEAVQSRVPFAIPVPELLPEVLELWATHMSEYPAPESAGADGAQTESEPQFVVLLTYKPDRDMVYDPSAALTLIVTNRTGLKGGYAVPAGAEESVEVNGQPAVYARGSWQRPDVNEQPDPANMVWNEEADAAMLSWEAGGFTFTLQAYQLGLSREATIQIAESVK
jgi:hypothetical protein